MFQGVDRDAAAAAAILSPTSREGRKKERKRKIESRKTTEGETLCI